MALTLEIVEAAGTVIYDLMVRPYGVRNIDIGQPDRSEVWIEPPGGEPYLSSYTDGRATMRLALNVWAWTVLTQAMGTVATNVFVASKYGYPASADPPWDLKIDNEIMTVTGHIAPATGFGWTVLRAQGGTTAANHGEGTDVREQGILDATAVRRNVRAVAAQFMHARSFINYGIVPGGVVRFRTMPTSLRPVVAGDHVTGLSIISRGLAQWDFELTRLPVPLGLTSAGIPVI